MFDEHIKPLTKDWSEKRRLLVCGSRDFYLYEVIETAIKQFDYNVVIIEGGAPGADTMARLVAENLGLEIEKYPADWKKYGHAAGPIRNQQMLDEGKPDLVYAFFTDIETSRGTRDMVKRALKAKIPVYAWECRVFNNTKIAAKVGYEEIQADNS